MGWEKKNITLGEKKKKIQETNKKIENVTNE